MTCLTTFAAFVPAPRCVGYPGPCDRPGTNSGANVGVPGRLCNRCRLRARRAHLDATRPLGDCGAGCGRAAASRRVIDGRAVMLCERCAERANRGATGSAGSRASCPVVPSPCVACGTPDGPPTRPGAGPGRVRGEEWGIPGAICLDCAEDARLGVLDPVDPPDAYLPTPAAIRRECAAIRDGWSAAEFRQRTVPAFRRVRFAPHRVPGTGG